MKRQQIKIPVVLTREEVESLIEVAEKDIKTSLNDHQRFNATRNVAVIRLLWSSGLRVQELANLNVDSIFPEEKRLKIQDGKFGNNDYQPVRKKETWEALERYSVLREKVDGRGSALFLSFYGQRIKARQIARDLKVYGSQAGVRKNVHPHTIRHTFGTEFYQATHDLLATQRALRHKRVSSTEIYCHIVKDDIEKGLVKADL